jgi:hypothetical protein
MELETIADTLIELLPSLLPSATRFVRDVRKPEKNTDEKLANLGALLTGRLVYLLRYFEQSRDARYPRSYGRVLAAYVDVGDTHPAAGFSAQAESAWEHAAQYACWYLSALGLLNQYGAVGGEVVISDLGKLLVRSDRIREMFRPAFEQRVTAH